MRRTTPSATRTLAVAASTVAAAAGAVLLAPTAMAALAVAPVRAGGTSWAASATSVNSCHSSGQVCAFEDAAWRGRYVYAAGNTFAFNLSGDMNDKISAIVNFTSHDVCFYEHSNLSGAKLTVHANQAYEGNLGQFQDSISSFKNC